MGMGGGGILSCHLKRLGAGGSGRHLKGKSLDAIKY